MPIIEPFVKERITATVDTTRNKLRVNATWVAKLKTYVRVPAFSLSSTWRGASEIIKEFRYSLSQPFSVISLINSTPREGFCPCIAWKPTSETIVRYKLWENVGEILYVPLYNGETVPANFSIEIWNVNPVSTSEPPVLAIEPGGELLVLEGESEGLYLELEGVGGIGTVTTVSHAGWRMRSSKLVIPSDKCTVDDIDVSNTILECTDVTFNFGDGVGDIADDFIPFDGDYYLVIGDCGVTQLIKGSRLVVTSFKLQDEDDLTWHNVFIFDLFGEKRLVVDQDPTTPGTTPFFTVRHLTKLTGFKVYLKTLFSEYRLHYFDTGLATYDYTVLYLSLAGLYYGSRMETVLGEDRLVTSQDGITI